MSKILANDGISESGKVALEEKGFQVITEKVDQENLIDTINKEDIEVLLVRSATTARKELIDACPNLKIIGRGGVGMDNIDVEYAKEKGLEVYNTPAASSSSSRSPSALTPPGPGFKALINIEVILAGPEISIPGVLNSSGISSTIQLEFASEVGRTFGISPFRAFFKLSNLTFLKLCTSLLNLS